MFKVLWDSKVLEDLKSIDKKIAINIVKKINEYLINDPFSLGKQLSATYSGLYRYRYGNYRIIYEILMQDQTIRIVKIGHRSKIY